MWQPHSTRKVLFESYNQYLTGSLLYIQVIHRQPPFAAAGFIEADAFLHQAATSQHPSKQLYARPLPQDCPVDIFATFSSRNPTVFFATC